MARSHEHLHRRHVKQYNNAEMNYLIQREAAPEPQTTVLSVIYVTAAQTFSGSVAGYTTIGVSDSATDSNGATQVGEPQAASSSISSVQDYSSPSSSAAPSVVYTPSPSESSSPKSYSSTAFTTSAFATSLITSTSSVAQYSSSTLQGTVAAASSSGTSDASSSSASTGTSTGSKIGIAVGVIVVLVAIAIGVLFAYGKKKKRNEEYARQEEEDEKTAFAASRAAAASAAASKKSENTLAPRLSLRPMSRLMRLSSGNPLNMLNGTSSTSKGPGRNLTPSPNPRPNSWDRNASASPEKATNPFSDPQNPFSDPEKGVSPPPGAGAGAIPMGAVATGAAGAVAAGALAARPNNEEQPNTQAPRNASPEPFVAAAADASAGASSNVYRVQMEFKPSMDDEIELRPGQLVRLLHEYDDGWALCIRLDRSQQGVAPRTCLSAKPCKPRPAGPMRPGPNGRPMSPAMGPGPNGRPMSPGMGRPMSPGMGRPMSPGMGRPMSPGMGPPNGRMSPAMGGRASPAMGMGMGGRASPAMGRAGPPQGRMSPAPRNGPPRNGPPPQNFNSNDTGAYNQSPRPLSPGPRPGPRQMQRSASPGPYGAGQGPRSMAPANQRRRSNSAGGILTPQGRQSPVGMSRMNPDMNPGAWPLPSSHRM